MWVEFAVLKKLKPDVFLKTKFESGVAATLLVVVMFILVGVFLSKLVHNRNP